MNWQSMTIRHKLFSGFGLILLVTVLFGAILLSGLFSINTSSRSLYTEKIPALSHTYQLQNHWQQAIFNLRSFSTSKDNNYYILANHHLSQALETLSQLQGASDNIQKDKWHDIEKELSGFRKQTAKAYEAAGKVEKSYAQLDSAQIKLQELSDNYLHLQYNKLKKDVDKKSADYIIKRRVDKINLMNEIVSAAENLKITIGETNYRNDPTLLNDLSASFDIVRNNVQSILPMTTKQYDVDALNEILVQNKICEQSLSTLKENWQIYNQLNDHNFLDRGLSLTMEMAEKQEAYLKRSAKSNLEHATNATSIWWWSISLSLLIGTLMAWRISRSLSDPLLELTHLAELQSDGILVSIPEIDRGDEIGKLTRSMKAHQDQTTRMVQALTNIGTSLNDLTQRLKSRSDELNESTTSQASSAEEISASVEEMQSLTENSSLEAGKAASDLERAKKDMDTYISQNLQAIDIMQSLISRSSSISELASQTYILSLNASIEAKRGDGNNNGFASIANAMRELAAKVKEVAGQLNSISEQGRSSSDEAINNLDNINGIISQNLKIMHQMASTSLKQNAETSHIASAIQQLNIQTQNTAQMVEFLTSEADHIESHSNELQDILSFYKKDNEKASNLPQVNQWEWAELLADDEKNSQLQEVRETALN
jgi:methyl-accepting chemotaxis protein